MKPIVLISLLFAGIQAHAQLDSCNVFLQGNYVEVGINFNGAYGSSVPPPDSGYCSRPYHPKGGAAVANDSFLTMCPSIACTGLIGLGFVADPDKDGWTVGSPYPYFGDYFLPGTPQEGWSIEADGMQVDNFNAYGCNANRIYGTANGSNISYTTSGSVITAVWQGTWDSLLITQTTTLDTSQTFFTTHVIIKNTGTTTRHDVYYQRTVDPDNTEPESGSFITKNKIEYQRPDTAHRVLVSLWGEGPGGTILSSAYLGLGTMDSNAKCFIFNTSGLLPPSGEKIDSLYGKYAGISSIPGGGDTVQTLMHQNDSETLDEGIGLVFKIGDLIPVDSIIIAYAYVFKRGVDLDSALKTTGHPLHSDSSGNPGDTSHHHTGINVATNKSTNIQAYPNPLTNEMTISALSVADQITVYDMMGRKVQSWIITKDGSNTFNTATLLQGMYILRVLDKDGNVKARLPIQKL